MALTDTTLKNSKPKNSDYKLVDEKGMYILITKSGGKYGRVLGEVTDKQEKLYRALGVEPPSLNIPGA